MKKNEKELTNTKKSFAYLLFKSGEANEKEIISTSTQEASLRIVRTTF